MIVDHIDHFKRYAVPKTDAILQFLKTHDPAGLPNGEMEIEGQELFVRIMSYQPKPAEENRFETHRIHADVQYIVSGAEIMQTARMEDLASLTEYDKEGDYHFFKANKGVSAFIVQAGEFAVFYPNQPHCTSCLYEGYKGMVKKLVFKVKIA